LAKFEVKKLETESSESSFGGTKFVSGVAVGRAIVGIAVGFSLSEPRWCLNSGSSCWRETVTSTSVFDHFLLATSKSDFGLCIQLKDSSFYLGLGFRSLDFATAKFAGLLLLVLVPNVNDASCRFGSADWGLTSLSEVLINN